MDEPIQTQDTPVVEDTTPAVQPATTDTPEPTQTTEQAVVTEETPVETAQPVQENVQEEEDDFDYPQQQIPQFQPIDFNNLPVGEDNLIDPNALAGSINQSIVAAEERATLRAQQAYQEQRAEEKNWDKAYEKYPELKSNKELRDLVHRARLGEVTDMLSRTQDPSSVKLPTPGQIADKFFKYANTQKAEGMKQAIENTKVQSSAYVESAGTRTNDNADTKAKLYQNINNSNKEVAKKARTDLLKSMLFSDE